MGARQKVLGSLAEEDVAGLRTPWGRGAGKDHVANKVFYLDVDPVRVQVALEYVWSYANVAHFFGGRKGAGGGVVLRAHVRAVGAVESKLDVGSKRLVHVHQRLCEEVDHKLGAVVQVSVKIPPFVGAFAPFCAEAVFPLFDLAFLYPEPLEVLRVSRQPRRHSPVAHVSPSSAAIVARVARA